MVAEVSEALAGYRTEEGLSLPQGTHLSQEKNEGDKLRRDN